MNKTIWKQQLQVCTIQEIELPETVQILCVQMQNNNPCIWFSKNLNDKHTVKRKFIIVGTGHEYTDCNNLTYIGTFQIDNGIYVFHLWMQKQ